MNAINAYNAQVQLAETIHAQAMQNALDLFNLALDEADEEYNACVENCETQQA